MAASLAGWAIDAMVEPFLGVGTAMAVSLVCSTVVFVFARRWLAELRGR